MILGGGLLGHSTCSLAAKADLALASRTGGGYSLDIGLLRTTAG